MSNGTAQGATNTANASLHPGHETAPLTGIVKKWFWDKGFGFIERQDGRGDCFVHINTVVSRVDELRIGQRVKFEEGTDRRTGRPCAVNVEVLS